MDKQEATVRVNRTKGIYPKHVPVPAGEKKKTGSRFTKTQREENRSILAARVLEGHTVPKIAADLGISVQQAYYDLKIVQERWRESASVNIDERMSVELVKLDKLEATYWEGYRRSCEELTKKTQRKRMGIGGKEQTDLVMVSEERIGDVRFLDGVARCIQQRCKLLGMEKDVLVAGNIINIDNANDLEKRMQRYAGLVTVADGGETAALTAGDDPGEPLDTERPASGETGVVLDTTGRVR